jgi:hypothetical protein
MASDEQKKRVGFFGWIRRIVMLLALGAIAAGGWWFYQGRQEVEVLKQIVSRLTAEERVAEVAVQDMTEDADGKVEKIRLKIVEIVSGSQPQEPIYCDFSVNDVVHFEALVIRLNDELIMDGKGKSIHIFRRAFALDDDGNTYESCVINKPREIPGGYRLDSSDPQVREVERRYWSKFWEYALDEKKCKSAGVKTAQIEAPATRFVKDKYYRIYLEHDGGLRIEAKPVPEVLKGERPKIETPDKTGEVSH